MGLSSLRRLARRLGYSWKRLRCSLKNCRDAMLLTFFQQELVLLHQAEARGELVVVYADECRFSRQVPYAWQRRGQPPVALPAKRGAGGYSVLGLWQAKAPCQLLLSYVLNGALTAEFFAAVPDEFSRHLDRPTVLVLDNASVHRAACVLARQAEWDARGLRLQLLSAYCPELNKIEVLWHRCKHYWRTSADYESEQCLLERLTQLLPMVGKEYTIAFS
jgi:hypothetical protein